MQLIAIIHTLWRRRIIVGLALFVSICIGVLFAYNVSLGVPPDLKSRRTYVGVASARVLVNTPHSIIADLNPTGGGNLPTHAQLLANLIASDAIRSDIAKTAGIPVTQLAVLPPSIGGVVQTTLATTATPPAGADTLTVNADADLPLVAIDAQAATPKQAAALANGAVTALENYVRSVATTENIPASRQAVITALGTAQGTTAARGMSPLYGMIATLVLFALSCYAIVFASGITRRMRELRQSGATVPGPEPVPDVVAAAPATNGRVAHGSRATQDAGEGRRAALRVDSGANAKLADDLRVARTGKGTSAAMSQTPALAESGSLRTLFSRK
jgi:hypothetical protein